MKRLNPKKDKEAKRKRNPLFWQTGGRQSFLAPTLCTECIKLQKIAREEKQKTDPAPVGKVWVLNQSIRCDTCKKRYEETKQDNTPTA